MQGRGRSGAVLGGWASCCCVCWTAGRERDGGVELRQRCGELCSDDQRADDGVDEVDCCGGGAGAERVQQSRAAGADGVWVCGRARVHWHGGRQRLRGVCVGERQRGGVQECWWCWAVLWGWAGTALGCGWVGWCLGRWEGTTRWAWRAAALARRPGGCLTAAWDARAGEVLGRTGAAGFLLLCLLRGRAAA